MRTPLELKVAEMRPMSMSPVFEALTTVTIEYTKDDGLVIVPKNTIVLVDVVRGICLVGNDHVVIEVGEYVLIDTHIAVGQ